MPPSIFDRLMGREEFGPPLPGATMQQNRSIFDILGGVPDPADPLDTASLRRAQLTDGLAGLSRGLLAAGGPSLMPTDFGSALGRGLSEGLSAKDSGEDRFLKRALVRSQVTKANSDIANDKAWQDMFKTPAAATAAAPAATGMPTPLTPAAGPTQWDPHFQTASTQTGISVPFLKAVAQAESGGNAAAVSPAGAAGPMQLMPGTAADLGVTNAKDPAQAIPAGAAYLRQQYDKYKDVDRALAAYNWGPANVDKWIAGGANPAQLPPETQQYIAKVKAGLPATPTHGTAAPPAYTYARLPPFQGVGLPQGAAPASLPMPQLAPPAAGPSPGVPGQIAQPPVQLAGMPAQGDSPPTAGPQVAPAPQVAAPAKTLPEVIQSLPPAVRQMMGAMPRKDALPLLMKYADPETHVAIDTTTGQIVFAPKTDNSGRYQPVDAMKLDIEKQNAESAKRQAAAREQSNNIRQANEPLQPPMIPGGNPTPTPGYAEQKGAVSAAEAGAKVGPALLQHQGELVIKDSQAAQVAADHARVGQANLNRLGALLDQVNTGKFQGTVQDLKASAKAAGVDLDALGVGDNVGMAQAAKALTGQLALGLRDPSGGSGMPGAMSDKDREFLVAMVPAITNDPNGNKLMLDWQKKLYQRQIEIGKIVNDYGRSPEFLKDPTGVYAKVREYADSHPLFDPEKDAPRAAVTPPAPPPGFKVVK